MILLLTPSEKVARTLTRRLDLGGGNRPFMGHSETFAVATVPTNLAEACATAGYLLGRLESSTASDSQIALATVALPPEASAAPLSRGASAVDNHAAADTPVLGFSVAGLDDRPKIYPDPLFTGALAPGSIRSPLIGEILRWAAGQLPTDMLYPLFLPHGETDRRAIDAVAAYVTRLTEEIPERAAPLDSEQEELLTGIAGALRLSYAGTERLLRAARDRVVRSGELPSEIYGYADIGSTNRQEGERVLTSILELLTEDAGG